MNLNKIANNVCSSVSPNITATFKSCVGYTFDEDSRERVQIFKETQVIINIQPLSSTDLRLIDNIELQGYSKSIYMNKQAYGNLRIKEDGSDVFLIDDEVWKVVKCVENWEQNGWSHVIVTLQQDNIS